MTRTDVLIAGAGPSGLALALWLTKLGVSVRIIDKAAEAGTTSRLIQPTAGLQVAHDPRIPAEFEALPMQIAPVPGFQRVDWYVDGILAAGTKETRYPWPLRGGAHSVRAVVWTETDPTTGAHATDDIRFYVR